MKEEIFKCEPWHLICNILTVITIVGNKIFQKKYFVKYFEPGLELVTLHINLSFNMLLHKIHYHNLSLVSSASILHSLKNHPLQEHRKTPPGLTSQRWSRCCCWPWGGGWRTHWPVSLWLWPFLEPSRIFLWSSCQVQEMIGFYLFWRFCLQIDDKIVGHLRYLPTMLSSLYLP